MDAQRARSRIQNVGPVADLWPRADGDIVVQVAMADRMLRRSTTRCAPFAPFPGSRVSGVSGRQLQLARASRG
jgi:hypothetical protein